MFELYVCEGEVEVVAVVVFPSPQLIVYLFGLPTEVIVNVTVVFSGPEVTFAVKSTLFTNVLLGCFLLFHLNHQ